MVNQKIQIPYLANLSFKNNQLRELQKFQDEAIYVYKHLKYRSDLVKWMIDQQHGTLSKIQNSIRCNTLMKEPTRVITANIIIYGSSQAKKFISRYTSSTDPINTLNLNSRNGYSSEIHIHCLYDIYYLSWLPISILGCFQCGSISYLYRKDFPKDHYVESKRDFWKDLWIHTPHTNKNHTHNQGSMNTYGPFPGLSPIFETIQPSPKLSNHNITIKR